MILLAYTGARCTKNRASAWKLSEALELAHSIDWSYEDSSGCLPFWAVKKKHSKTFLAQDGTEEVFNYHHRLFFQIGGDWAYSLDHQIVAWITK